MEHHILIIILAIATFFFINFSTAAAMAENSEFELPESGQIIYFGDAAAIRTAGGLDPPAGALSRRPDDAQTADRFEMGESGILVDFNRRTADGRIVGFRPEPFFDRPVSVRAAQGKPTLEVYEMPESGHLIVFPRQVEKRKAQALRMQLRERVVSDKN